MPNDGEQDQGSQDQASRGSGQQPEPTMPPETPIVNPIGMEWVTKTEVPVDPSQKIRVKIIPPTSDT